MLSFAGRLDRRRGARRYLNEVAVQMEDWLKRNEGVASGSGVDAGNLFQPVTAEDGKLLALHAEDAAIDDALVSGGRGAMLAQRYACDVCPEPGSDDTCHLTVMQEVVDELLQKGAVSTDTYIRKVRQLSKRQFLVREAASVLRGSVSRPGGALPTI